MWLVLACLSLLNKGDSLVNECFDMANGIEGENLPVIGMILPPASVFCIHATVFFFFLLGTFMPGSFSL